MRNNTKSLVRKLLVLLPALVLLVGLFVGMSQMAFAQGLTTSASHFGPAPTPAPAAPTPSPQCPSGEVSVVSQVGLSCFGSGIIGPINLNHVVSINPDRYNVIFRWAGCDPQHEVHTSTVHAESIASFYGRTYAGCRGYLGTVTSLSVS